MGRLNHRDHRRKAFRITRTASRTRRRSRTGSSSTCIRSEANRPAFVDSTYTKTHYYSLENSYIYLKKEDTYATVRGPGYVPSYDRYSLNGSSSPPAIFHADDMSIVVPQKPAPGKPWVFHASPLEPDSAVALALLAKGYYLVLPPISGPGAVQKEWDEVYQRMVDNGFATKVGDGGDRGEGGRRLRVGDREPGQGLGDLRPQSAHAQPDVERRSRSTTWRRWPRPGCRSCTTAAVLDPG